MDNQQIDGLKTFADYTNPDGNLSFVESRIRKSTAFPCFAAKSKPDLTKSGQIIRVINNLAPGLDYDSLSNDFRNPVDAVKAAARHINHELTPADTRSQQRGFDRFESRFRRGRFGNDRRENVFPDRAGRRYSGLESHALPAGRCLLCDG